MKKVLLTTLLSFSSVAFATSRTVSEGKGTSHVMRLGNQSLVYVYGEAAEVLFDSLDVEAVTPTGSTSVIKSTKKGVSCTQNTDQVHCVIAVSTR